MDNSTAILYASLVKIAGTVQPTGGYGQTEIDEIQKLGYQFLDTISANDLATNARKLTDVVTFGFTAMSPAGELVVVLRGTATILEWIHDAQFEMVDCPVAGISAKTEDGFTALYKSLLIGKFAALDYVRGLLLEAKTVTVCGHSLGAALATLLALDVATNTSCHDPACYTFASPRVGDHAFVQAFNAAVSNNHRFANRLDLVPKLPLVPYEHVDTHYELVPDIGKVNWTIPCMHHMTTYLWLLGGAPVLDKDCGR